MVEDAGTREKMFEARSSTWMYLERLKGQITFSLGFAALTILVNLFNFVAMVMTRHLSIPQEEIATIIAPHVVLLPLSIMVVLHFVHLRKVREDLIFLGVDKDGHADGMSERSLTDIHYDMVREMRKVFRLWVPTAVIFIIYFAWGAVLLVGWALLNMFPGAALAPISVLNIITYVLAIIYFSGQTDMFLRWRRKNRKLEAMERKVQEELDL